MSLVVLGLNHRTAPVEVRERVVFDAGHLSPALRDLCAQPGVQEGVIVSTCNRTELYCAVNGSDPRLTRWLQDYQHTGHDLVDCTYELHGPAAVEHVFAVASGLDSLIIGEPQILGQLKDAYRAAHEAGTAGPMLNKLFQATFAVAKRVRTETRIGASAVSVASAGVQLARRIFAGFEQHTALLIGAGEMIELTARHLHAQGLKRMIIANRSLNRAQDLAVEFKASAITLDALAEHLPQADIVISSTASPVPVVTFEATKAAISARRRKPMFMLDIAVPRDIEPRIAQLEDVYLYTIDDLRQVVDDNLRSRQEEAEEARSLVSGEVERFMSSLRTLDAVPTIRQLRARAETTRQQTLEQARKLMAAGKHEQALEFLSNTLTHRLLHAPSSALRDAGEQGDAMLINAAHRLFGLDEET
ncbi:MAG: glutamyl-tRNA reductase [Steroidobacteraceae bacterium]|jgi:glutamyl-tRNA reductase|nr:glutamyl-tRNA reductase [Steroidobacteraceae bacterium]